VLHRKSDRLRLSKAKSKSRISGDKDSRVKYGEQTEPEQESLAISPPKGMKSHSSNTECCYDVADKQENDSTTHKLILLSDLLQSTPRQWSFQQITYLLEAYRYRIVCCDGTFLIKREE
jgi:hypothetical protein